LLPSALWESNRLVGCCYVGSRVRHDAPSALRGPFSYSEHVAAGGAFSGHLPFVAFLLVAAIVLVSCCVSSITVGSLGHHPLLSWHSVMVRLLRSRRYSNSL
jgi:hypothetical protein